MTENISHAYWIIARIEWVSYDPANKGKVFQLLLSCRDREEGCWVNVPDKHSWEGFTVGDTVIYDGKTLCHENLPGFFPVPVTELL